jgi:hypothetical protein
MKSCCRCLTNLTEPFALGGNYGGVVCINHRICSDCWWNSDTVSYNKGRRRIEKSQTRNIALVNNPRKNEEIKCYGCLYSIEPYNDIIVYKGIGTNNEPIEIE